MTTAFQRPFIHSSMASMPNVGRSLPKCHPGHVEHNQKFRCPVYKGHDEHRQLQPTHYYFTTTASHSHNHNCTHVLQPTRHWNWHLRRDRQAVVTSSILPVAKRQRRREQAFGRRVDQRFPHCQACRRLPVCLRHLRQW